MSNPNPYAAQSPMPMQANDRVAELAAKQAAGGQDLIDYIRSLEHRIERLEATLKTH